MSDTVCRQGTAPVKPPLPGPAQLTAAEVQQLLVAHLGDRTELLEEEAMAVVAWGQLMRQGAQLLELVMAGAARLVVQDGEVIEAWPVGQEVAR